MNVALYFNIVKGFLWSPSPDITPPNVQVEDKKSQPEPRSSEMVKVKPKQVDKSILDLYPSI